MTWIAKHMFEGQSFLPSVLTQVSSVERFAEPKRVDVEVRINGRNLDCYWKSSLKYKMEEDDVTKEAERIFDSKESERIMT